MYQEDLHACMRVCLCPCVLVCVCVACACVLVCLCACVRMCDCAWFTDALYTLGADSVYETTALDVCLHKSSTGSGANELEVKLGFTSKHIIFN